MPSPDLYISRAPPRCVHSKQGPLGGILGLKSGLPNHQLPTRVALPGAPFLSQRVRPTFGQLAASFSLHHCFFPRATPQHSRPFCCSPTAPLAWTSTWDGASHVEPVNQSLTPGEVWQGSCDQSQVIGARARPSPWVGSRTLASKLEAVRERAGPTSALGRLQELQFSRPFNCAPCLGWKVSYCDASGQA